MSFLFRLLSLVCFVAAVLLGIGLIAGLSGGMKTLDIALAVMILIACVVGTYLFNRLSRRRKYAS